MRSAVAAVLSVVCNAGVDRQLWNPVYIPDNCSDDPQFIDSHGHTCADWVGKDCSLHCPLEKCHYPGDYSPEEVQVVRDKCRISCGTCTSFHETVHNPTFSCHVWNGGSMHVEECRPGVVSAHCCFSASHDVYLHTERNLLRSLSCLHTDGMCICRNENKVGDRLFRSVSLT